MKLKFFLLIAAAVLTFGLAACGGDSNDEKGGPDSSKPLVGTWENLRTGDWGFEKHTKVFNADGSGYQLYESSDNTTGENINERVDLSYNMQVYDPATKKGVAKVVHSTGEVWTVPFSFVGNTLVWGDMSFTRK